MKNISYIIIGVITSLCILAPAAWAQDANNQYVCVAQYPCDEHGNVAENLISEDPNDYCFVKFSNFCKGVVIEKLIAQNKQLNDKLAKLKAKKNKGKNRK